MTAMIYFRAWQMEKVWEFGKPSCLKCHGSRLADGTTGGSSGLVQRAPAKGWPLRSSFSFVKNKIQVFLFIIFSKCVRGA